jgi:hypothetical protein
MRHIHQISWAETVPSWGMCQIDVGLLGASLADLSALQL